MKVLLSWLRDFVDVPGRPEDVATTMSVRGFAVEGIEAAGDNDAVIDFEVTANRPDCLSVSGFAREVATAYGLGLRQPSLPSAASQAPALEPVEHSEIDVAIEAPDLCPRYVAAVADITVGPSPAWMQSRLRAADVRPTSNIVDVTNYVLLELGQPMHAFDFARLGGGQIRVRAARPGETLRTLDNRVRELAPDMLVIADATRPVAIAGVMGGAESEVKGGTRAIVLESAYFNPLSVRRTSRALDLKTEASIRFERGADPRIPDAAMRRACALLYLIGAGKARGTFVDRHSGRLAPTVLPLRREKITSLLGTSIPDEEVRRILESLGCALQATGDGWNVTVPTWRVDVTREVDLIEEAARHYGLNRIPVTFPRLAVAPPPVDPRITRARQLRGLMTGQGFSEAVTFGFCSAQAAAPFAVDQSPVPIKNPLSEAFAVLRPSLLPGLVESAGRNIRRGRRDAQLFEIGSRFGRRSGESEAVAFVWTGASRPQHWSERARDVDLFDAKGVVSAIAEAVGVTMELQPTHASFLVPGQAATVVARANGPAPAGLIDAHIGLVGRLLPALGDTLGLPATVPTFVAELALDPLVGLRRISLKAVAPPRFPLVERDISVLLDESTPAGAVRESLHALAIPILAGVREFDRYQGAGVPDGKVSLSIRLTFLSPDRTLTDAEVQGAVDALLRVLAHRHGATQR